MRLTLPLFSPKIDFPFTFQEWYEAFPIKDDDDQKPEFIMIQDHLMKTYGDNGWIFWSFSIALAREALTDHDWDNFDSEITRKKLIPVFEKVKRIPIKYIKKSIGSGCFGMVLPHGKNKIKKIFYKPMNKFERKFYLFCKTGRSNVFPKVYKITEHYIIMEKLTPNTLDVQDFVDYLLSPELFKKNQDFDEIKIWGDEVKRELKFLFGIDGYGDLRPDNVGERPNGDIIYFDPIGGKEFLEIKVL
jgi:hypothetical protein